MIKRTVSDLKPYDAPGHYNMGCHEISRQRRDWRREILDR